jgi:alpha-L-fucosidase
MTDERLSRRDCLKLMGAGAAWSAMPGLAPSGLAQRAATTNDARMAWWRDARFGMFIHWGLYAIPAGVWNGVHSPKSNGEWIMNDLRIPIADYQALAGQFNPTAYDPREWVRIARGAGMKYIVITSKHHDGFALWDSKASDYDAMATPYRRDLLSPLAEACRADGLRFCTYHSIMDWHHPDYLPRREWDARPAAAASFDRYVAYLKAQLTELVTGYHPAVLWFDGEWENTWTHERGVDLYDYVRGLDPDILINNRVDKGRRGMQGMNRDTTFKGDFGTPEQQIPATGLPGVDWETCMTMNDTWGFRQDDEKWKSSATLIRNLIDTASKGGNFLLNVGPTAEGRIPAASVERLAAMGRWMATNADAIYATTASPFGAAPWGRCTQKPGALFVHVFDWPGDGRISVPFGGRVRQARLLAAPSRRVAVESSEQAIHLTIDGPAPDPVASVIKLELVR